MFEKFKPYSVTIGLPNVSITNNGMNFSKTAVAKLGNPKYIMFMLNEEEKQMLVKVCEDTDAYAVKFAKTEKINSVRFNNKDLLQTIEKMMIWNLKLQGYRITGDYFDEEAALLFDLNKAKTIEPKDNEMEEEE